MAWATLGPGVTRTAMVEKWPARANRSAELAHDPTEAAHASDLASVDRAEPDHVRDLRGGQDNDPSAIVSRSRSDPSVLLATVTLDASRRTRGQ